MTGFQLTEEQEASIEEFAATESDRVAQIVVKNKKRKAKEKENTVGEVQEFVRKYEWPDRETAKDWLTKADPTRKLGLVAGLSIYNHEACARLFDALKETDVTESIKQVRRIGYCLAREGVQVMRYNALVLSFLTGMYWSGAVPGVGSQIGFWVRLWWDGVPGWRGSGPPVHQHGEYSTGDVESC